jgi:hypothetical protein
VLTAKCSEAASALHYAVKLCCSVSFNAERTPSGVRACIEVIVKAAHDANCLQDVLSVQDEQGVSAATWLLRVGYSDFVALLPSASSLKVRLTYDLYCHMHCCITTRPCRERSASVSCKYVTIIYIYSVVANISLLLLHAHVTGCWRG